MILEYYIVSTIYYKYMIETFLFSLNELKDKEYYRLKVKGKFLYEKEFLMGPRSLILNGEAVSEKSGGIFSRKAGTGYYVITPFKLEDQE